MTRPAVILPILVVFSILMAVVVWRLVWVSVPVIGVAL